MNKQQASVPTTNDEALHVLIGSALGQLNAISRVVIKGLEYSTIYGLMPITEVAKLRLLPKKDEDSDGKTALPTAVRDPYPRLSLLDVIITYQQLFSDCIPAGDAKDDLFDQLSALVEIYQFNAAALSSMGEKVPHLIFNSHYVMTTGSDGSGEFKPLVKTTTAELLSQEAFRGVIEQPMPGLISVRDEGERSVSPAVERVMAEELLAQPETSLEERLRQRMEILGQMSQGEFVSGYQNPGSFRHFSSSEYVAGVMEKYGHDTQQQTPKGKAAALVCLLWLAGREARMDVLFSFERMIYEMLHAKSYPHPHWAMLSRDMEAIIRSPQVLPSLGEKGMVRMLEGIALISYHQRHGTVHGLVKNFEDMGRNALGIPYFPALSELLTVIPKQYYPDILLEVINNAGTYIGRTSYSVLPTQLIVAVANRDAKTSHVSLNEVDQLFKEFGNYHLPLPIYGREDLQAIFNNMNKEKLELIAKGLQLQVQWETPSPDGQKGISWTSFVRSPAQAMLEAVQAAVGDDLNAQAMMLRAIRRYL